MAPLVRFNEEEATATFNGVLRHSEKCITIISRLLPLVNRERHVMAKPTLKRRSDGRYVKTVKDKRTGKRKSFYGKTEREVYRKIFEYEQKQEDGRTFAEVADEWWDDIYSTLALQSLKCYTPAYKRARAEFGKDLIQDIEARDISAFLMMLAEAKFAKKTIANQRCILNQIFTRAVLNGDVQHNPCASVRSPKNTAKRTVTAASVSDEAKILSSDHEWLFPLCALLTGLRKGELLALQWKDVNFEEKEILVYKSVEHEAQRPSIKTPKTDAGTRIVPLLDVLAERLKPIKSDSEHYLFSDDGGKSPLRKARFDWYYREYKKAVGITATPHQLRHSYATNSVEENINPKILQATIGHADFSTTMNTYVTVRKERQKEVAEKLNARYKNTQK